MSDLTLDTAQTLLIAALAAARTRDLNPVAVAVLDARGALKAFAAEDGTSLKRFEIAHGKAHGALSIGLGSRSIHARALKQPYFIAAVTHAAGGSLVPAPGGVLIRDGSGRLIGAIGITGDSSDNDEAAALEAIAATGLTGDPGSD